MGVGRPGRRQNRTFGVDEMVRKKVFGRKENFWVMITFFRVRRGKHFRVRRIEQGEKVTGLQKNHLEDEGGGADLKSALGVRHPSYATGYQSFLSLFTA